MQISFQSLFDFVFPPSEGALRVRACTTAYVERLYTPQEIETDMYALAPYKHPTIRALIHEAKFRGNKKAFLLLNVLVQKFLMNRSYDMIVPIPLSPARLRERGYNQVRAVLTAQPLLIPIPPLVLVRKRNTRPQTELKRDERLANMHDAFGVVHGASITGKRILLVDDVTTTGATLKTAKASLLPYKPASITCLALAH